MSGKAKINTKVWAHRGASAYAPENTLEAFLMAEKMGADGVELDVQLSLDGRLVVIHDEELSRVAGVGKNVRDLTLFQLKELDVSRPIEGFRTVRIPTLEEVFEALMDTGMEINVECKNGLFFYPGLEEAALKLVERMGMKERVIFSSFNHRSMVKVKKLCPEVKTGFLTVDVLARAASYTKKNGADALHPAIYHMQDEKLVAKCHKKGLAVHLWTVNEREDIRRFSRMGVDAVITNYPDVAREELILKTDKI